MVKAEKQQNLAQIFPPLRFTINGSPFQVKSEDLLNICFRIPEKELQTTEKYLLCGLNLGKAMDGRQILGIPFFISNYVVFDWERKRIGFYAKTERNLLEQQRRAEYYSKNKQEVSKELLKVIDLESPGPEGKNTNLDYKHLKSIFGFGGGLEGQENASSSAAHEKSILFPQNPDDLQYLMYILIGIDCILGSIIIAYIWRKRYVFATGRFADLLRV